MGESPRKISADVIDSGSATQGADGWMARTPTLPWNIEDALRANPEEFCAGPRLRVCGELRLKQGDRSLAAADFREAITFAQKMGARARELLAMTSLARLLRDIDSRDEVCTILAGIYG